MIRSLCNVSPVQSSDRADLAVLLDSYRSWLVIHLSDDPETFQVGGEVQQLRENGHYSDTYHLARNLDGDAVGCVSVAVSGAIAKISRFHVPQPGQGVGRQLLLYALQHAADRQAQYAELDTSIKMLAAQRLYVSVGFQNVTAEHRQPEPEVIYFRKSLSLAAAQQAEVSRLAQ